ncbi:MAG: hypothetical protein EXR69_15290 [Myxococcales bacterium]|nr:hypothetical protein [Myxococcales bacterium]
MIYVDGTIASSELAGILVVVGILWAVWASTWLIRVEVHALAAPLVNRLGLRWAREGVSTRVLATGEGQDGRPIQLKFGRGEEPGTLRIWRRAESGRPWDAVGADDL